MDTDKFAYDSIPVDEEQRTYIQDMRDCYKELAEFISLGRCPTDARYLALAKTKLEESCMWAIKAITHYTTTFNTKE